MDIGFINLSWTVFLKFWIIHKLYHKKVLKMAAILDIFWYVFCGNPMESTSKTVQDKAIKPISTLIRHEFWFTWAISDPHSYSSLCTVSIQSVHCKVFYWKAYVAFLIFFLSKKDLLPKLVVTEACDRPCHWHSDSGKKYMFQILKN